MGALTDNLSNSAHIKRELISFIDHPKELWPTLLDKNGSILWDQIARSFPNVSNLGMMFLIIAASSSSIERVFSRENRIVISDRIQMAPLMLDALMLACSNDDVFAKIIEDVQFYFKELE